MGVELLALEVSAGTGAGAGVGVVEGLVASAGGGGGGGGGGGLGVIDRELSRTRRGSAVIVGEKQKWSVAGLVLNLYRQSN